MGGRTGPPILPVPYLKELIPWSSGSLADPASQWFRFVLAATCSAGPSTRPTSHRVLDAFVDEGFNFIDTADVYSRWAPGNSGGESETIIGSWLKGRSDRDKLVIATKVGMEMGPGKKGLAPAYIRASVEDSLRRLQTDYIDLYQSHADDPETPFEEVLGAHTRT